MHRDEIDLARRLFAAALAKLEDATAIACRGQPADVTQSTIRREAKMLQAVALDLGVIAGATLALTNRIDTRAAPQTIKTR